MDTNTEPPAASFQDFLSSRIDQAIGAEPAKEAAAAQAAPVSAPTTEPATEPAKEAAPVVAPKVEVPPSLTQALAGKEPVAPAAKPEEKPSHTPLDDAAEKALDTLFTTKQGEAFKSVKAQVKERDSLIAQRDAELAQLRKAIEEAKTSGPKPEELDAIKIEAERLKAEGEQVRKIKDEYERELSLIKVEATEEFKRAVGEPLAALKAEVARIAKANDVPEGEIMAALTEGDPTKKADLLSNLGLGVREYDRHKLYSIDQQYAGLVARERSVKDNAAAALKLIEDNRKAQITALQANEVNAYKAGLDTAWSDLTAKVPLFRPVDGADQWNANLRNMEQFARTVDINTLAPDQKASLVFQGASLPLVLGVTEFYANRIVELEAEISAMRKGAPGAGGGNAAPVAAAPVGQGMSFLEAIEARAAAAGLSR